MISKKADVEAVLLQARNAIDDDSYGFFPVRKTRDAFLHFGIMESDAIEVIRQLTYQDYCHGPDPDRDFPLGEPLWFFKCVFMGEIIYIKFLIRKTGDSSIKLMVLSFHPDELRG